MTRDEWEKVDRIFKQAVAREPSERHDYVHQACGDDRACCDRVLAQLAADERGRNLLGIASSLGGHDVSHYRMLEQIGKGGMGLVYKARDLRLERFVAIKVVHPYAVNHPKSRERLRREAKAASALNHPNIVTVYEIEEAEGLDLIVMEYVSGETLEALTPARGLSLDAALHYAIQIASALTAAHAAGILHRDLKPSNIMVTATDAVKLLDFGLAQVLRSNPGDTAQPVTQDSFGTKAYMAPELLRNIQAIPDPRSEIFAFGLILFEMLTGRHAFGRGTPEAISRAILIERPRVLSARVPESAANIVKRCLEKDPDARFQSASQMLAAIRELTGGATGPVPQPIPPSDLWAVRLASNRLGHDNIPQSRRALTELERLLSQGPSQAVRQAITQALKNLILAGHFSGGVPGGVRELRQNALELLRVASSGDFDFERADLEHLDLYGMNFTQSRMVGLSFKSCLLIESSFRGARLAGASFTGAYLRNVNMADADITRADFTDADWFNTLGLTAEQLTSAQQGTVLDCPSTEEAMHRYLSAHYGFPFESWSSRVKEQLRTAWDEYSRPGGLRDLVAGWRRS